MTFNLKWHEISNDMKSQMTWNLTRYEISKDMKSQKTWNLKRHEISNDMKSQMTWNVKRHKISNILKCKMSWNVKCHEMLILMLDLWPQAETPGVTHFGAYNRPPDGHFFLRHDAHSVDPKCWLIDLLDLDVTWVRASGWIPEQLS